MIRGGWLGVTLRQQGVRSIQVVELLCANLDVDTKPGSESATLAEAGARASASPWALSGTAAPPEFGAPPRASGARLRGRGGALWRAQGGTLNLLPDARLNSLRREAGGSQQLNGGWLDGGARPVEPLLLRHSRLKPAVAKQRREWGAVRGVGDQQRAEEQVGRVLGNMPGC